MNSADRRGVNIGIKPSQPFPDLRRAPGRLILLQTHDQRLDLDRKLVSMAVGPPRTVGQRLKAAVVVASDDFVAGLARNAELSASSNRAMNFRRSSMGLHTFQGILRSSQKAPLCNPCLRNELSLFSQEGHNGLDYLLGAFLCRALLQALHALEAFYEELLVRGV